MSGKVWITLSCAAMMGVGLTSPVAAEPADKAAGSQTAPSAGGESGGNLSNKLNRSNGVIKPKEGIDPGIKAEPPVSDPGTTPVIPPAATGGTSAK